MTHTLTQFASTPAATGSIFEALGIDWKILILQIIAFLILVWILSKFVYPWLMKSVDERQASIEAASKAAAQAQATAVEVQAKVAKLLKEAQLSAADIVATAKLESITALNASEQKAQQRADQIVSDAQSEIAKDVLAAKKVLYNETLELVAMATEKVVGKVVTSKANESIISDAIKAVKK
ncbi:F0F1 ATP synthase subunit B [Candidatus Saccharibacteria bacterium]|nr:F0F1 ATP synthase subunit B [Candidatus Saccharibacteria bacterium]